MATPAGPEPDSQSLSDIPEQQRGDEGKFTCDRCGARMFAHGCKISCPNCGHRFDCSDLNLYFD